MCFAGSLGLVWKWKGKKAGICVFTQVLFSVQFITLLQLLELTCQGVYFFLGAIQQNTGPKRSCEETREYNKQLNKHSWFLSDWRVE